VAPQHEAIGCLGNKSEVRTCRFGKPPESGLLPPGKQVDPFLRPRPTRAPRRHRTRVFKQAFHLRKFVLNLLIVHKVDALVCTEARHVNPIKNAKHRPDMKLENRTPIISHVSALLVPATPKGGQPPSVFCQYPPA